MDLAKSGLIGKDLLNKGRGAEIFSKFRPTPILRELFEDSALPITAAYHYDPNCQQSTALSAAFYLWKL